MKNIGHPIPSLRFAALIATFATLAGCGGGGGGDGDGSSSNGTDPIDKYVGTFVFSCFSNSRATLSTGGALYSQVTLSSPAKLSATKLTYVYTLRSYTSADCSGTAAGTVTLASDGNNYLQVDGTTTVGTQTVDKITFGIGVLFPGISASTITVNGVSYSGSAYTSQTPQTEKDIALFKSNALYLGDSSQPLDAQGYPTALENTSAATKL